MLGYSRRMKMEKYIRLNLEDFIFIRIFIAVTEYGPKYLRMS
jgi:hypothetical protein